MKSNEYNDAEKFASHVFGFDDVRAFAAAKLGECFFYGYGVAQDYAEAFQFCKIAAESGDADSQYILWLCYKGGKGVNQNNQIAQMWLEVSAKNGNLKAKAQKGEIAYLIGLAAKKIKDGATPVIDGFQDGFYSK
jgi:TPR repeat protein